MINRRFLSMCYVIADDRLDMHDIMLFTGMYGFVERNVNEEFVKKECGERRNAVAYKI